jgi:hypothetical protein
VQADQRLAETHNWLTFLERPNDMSDQDYTSLVRFASRFFVDNGLL